MLTEGEVSNALRNRKRNAVQNPRSQVEDPDQHAETTVERRLEAATLNAVASIDPNAQVYTASTRNFSCSLTAAALPPLAQMGIAANPAAMDQVFAEMKKGMLGMKPGTCLISETRIQHGTTRGMEMRVEIGDLVNVSRSFVTGTHLIASEIVFKKGTEPATERDRYFNSLQLTGAPAGGAALPGMNLPPGMPGGSMPPPKAGMPARP